MEAFPEKTRTALISSFIGNALDTYDFAMFAVNPNHCPYLL